LSLVVDGLSTAIFSTASSGTLTGFSNSNAGDIIICQIFFENLAASRTVSTVTTSGLTWTRRSQTINHMCFNADNVPDTWGTLEVWWAYSSAVLTNASVAITLSAAIDNCAVMCWGVSGFNGTFYQTNPWDINGSLPAIATGNVSIPTVAGVSTTSSNTLGIMTQAGFAAEAAGTGWTNFNSILNNGGTFSAYTSRQTQLFPSPQSSATWSFTNSVRSWATIADALVQNPAASVTTKQIKNSLSAPDGSEYGTLTDGAGTLVVTSTTSTGNTKQIKNSRLAPDGSKYMTLTDGNGNLV